MAATATKRLAVWVVRRLRAAGHEALLAGGCVRDMLRGARPADYDVATSATPRQVEQLFHRVRMVGAKFGVAMVIRRGERIEVATFRTDRSYSDGRRPDAVQFASAREDALRRDFTVNGMFYDPVAAAVVDYVGGQKDLAARLIRAIGNPRKRFAEDHLRMLRAVRFAAKLDFRIEDATAAAIRAAAPKIRHISGERIREELEKMFSLASAPAALRQLLALGLLEAVLPELFAREGLAPTATARAQALAGRRDAALTLAALLAGLPAGELRAIVRRWGGSNQLRGSLLWLAQHLHQWRTAPDASLAELKRLLQHGDSGRLQAIWRHEELAATGSLRCYRAIRRRIRRIDPSQISPPPLIDGADLIKLGLLEGPLLGRILSRIYRAQLNEQLGTRRQALICARKLIAESQ